MGSRASEGECRGREATRAGQACNLTRGRLGWVSGLRARGTASAKAPLAISCEIEVPALVRLGRDHCSWMARAERATGSLNGVGHLVLSLGAAR